MNINIRKVLWLEDQYENFEEYISTLYRAGYLLDIVESVAEAIRKIRKEDYVAYIFDIKVLPGDDDDWIILDETKRKKKSNFDSYLGFELLVSLLKPSKATVKIEPPLKKTLDPKKIIALSVVADKREEIAKLGVLERHIIYKSASHKTTLPELIRGMEENEKKKTIQE